jgi:selenocysteine-specific elongation factor
MGAVAGELAACGLNWPGLENFAGSSPTIAAAGLEAIEVVRHLADHGLAVAVNNEYYVHAEAMADLVARLRDHFAGADDLGFAAFRELSGLTRKLGIPMLEYLDERGYTVREGDLRRAGPAL